MASNLNEVLDVLPPKPWWHKLNDEGSREINEKYASAVG